MFKKVSFLFMVFLMVLMISCQEKKDDPVTINYLYYVMGEWGPTAYDSETIEPGTKYVDASLAGESLLNALVKFSTNYKASYDGNASLIVSNGSVSIADGDITRYPDIFVIHNGITLSPAMDFVLSSGDVVFIIAVGY